MRMTPVSILIPRALSLLWGEETKLVVGDVHAVCNLDLLHCAFIVFNVKNEGPMSFDGEAALNSLRTGLRRE